MRKILFVLLLITSLFYSQWLNPPYRLTPIDTVFSNIVTKGSYFNKGKIDYVGTTNNRMVKFDRFLRISTADGKTIDIKIPGRKILSKFYTINLDKDSLDELIFGASGNHILDIYLFNNGKNEKIFTIEISKKIFNGKFIAIPSNDHTNSIIIIIVSVLPNPGSIRGMFKIDLSSKKIIWKKYFADAVSAFYPFKKDNKNLLALFSYARNEKLFFANGRFIYKRFTPNVKIDVNAPDYSCDTVSTLKIYDISDGSLIYKKNIAKKGVKVTRFNAKVKEYDLLLNFKQYSLSNRETDRLVGFSIKDYSLTTLLNYPHRVTNRQIINILSNSIVQKNDSIAFVVKNGKLTEIKLTFPPLIRVNDFYPTKLGYVFLAKNIYNGLIYDENQNILVKSKTLLTLFDPEHNIYASTYYINGVKKTVLYKLTSLFIFDRISTKGYIYLLMMIVFLVLFLFIVWSGTLWVSFNKIKKQNRDLEQMTTKLLQAEKLSTLGTIAGSIAHQINSPLGAIINASERLKREKTGDKNVELIYNAGERIKVIIQKFLLSTKKESAKNVTFNEVFNKWYSLFSRDFIEQAISLEFDIQNGDVTLPLNWDELNEIINNTMFNARDSVVNTNSPDERTIRVETELINDSFVIRIIDNGSGFDKKYLKDGIKLFKTTKERGKGTGLGLWIIETILKKIGGKIIMKNGQKGAIVSIIIPVTEK